MGYIGQQLWDIFSQNNQKYYGIYWLKIVGYICKTMEYWLFGYIKQKPRDILDKIMGYIGQKLWDILWDIFVKAMGYI